MLNKESVRIIEKIGFSLVDSGYYGIYRHEVYENEEVKFVVCMDKCFYESYVYSKVTNGVGGDLLKVIRRAISDENYFREELSTISAHAKLEPNRCASLLVAHYPAIISYFRLA